MKVARLPLFAPLMLLTVYIYLTVRANTTQHVSRIDQNPAHNPNYFTEPGRQLLENSTTITNSTLQDPEEEEEELPSCNDVLLHETIQDRCHHAQNCEGEYIMTALLPLAFCKEDHDDQQPSDNAFRYHHHPILLALFPILFPLALFLMTLLLFRLLGSTAENYFSPALEMISSEFNIPPALAGVTLLALGNGAPDVSAVVNAIKMNASEGIPLSLGELTGGGMFVQTVVVGRIVFLGSSIFADGDNKVLGVKCREELIRDITMYAISAGYVLWVCSKGVIFYRHVVAMLLLYLTYVVVVVVYEVRRYYSKSEEYVVEGDIIENNTVEKETGEQQLLGLIHTKGPSFDEEDQTVELSSSYRQVSSSENLSARKTSKQPDPPGIKQSARVLRVIQKQERRRRQKMLEKRKSLNVDDKIPDPQDRPSSAQELLHEDTEGGHRSLQLFSDSLRELYHHFYSTLVRDIWLNGQLSRFEWFCMSLESPFIIVRKLVTPIPCQAEYNQSMVAYSIAFSPVWILFYLSTKIDDFDPFCTTGAENGDGSCFPSVVWPCCISLAIGCAVIKYAPKEDGSILPLQYSLPLALFGFLIAATWIDVISDQLVNVLEFIGVLLRIPAPIMGMTVLAWGNSVGDYTTNGILAQKGLVDMSMAACFAGPSFNLLVGLGCGLLTQKESLLSDDGLMISLGSSVRTGFIFLIFNCAVTVFIGIWNKAVIPKM